MPINRRHLVPNRTSSDAALRQSRTDRRPVALDPCSCAAILSLQYLSRKAIPAEHKSTTFTFEIIFGRSRIWLFTPEREQNLLKVDNCCCLHDTPRQTFASRFRSVSRRAGSLQAAPFFPAT